MKKRYFLLPLALALASFGSSHAQTLPCTNPISSFPYNENFDSGPGGWTTGIDAGTQNTWALGTPSKPVINSAFSGPNSWIVGGLSGTYPDNENSYVLSPCFNFSSLGLPILEMKVWWNSEFSWDGAVLQSSINGGNTWQNVGTVGDPNNWYTDNSIGGNPGGQSEGWTGRASSGNGSGGWVTAKHALTGLAGQANVRLRIAFGSDGSVEDDGFAFDNVQIYQPTAIDVGVSAIEAPITSTLCASVPLTVRVRVENYGSVAQSNIPVSYTVNGTGTVSAIIPGPLQPGAAITFTFPTGYTPAGNGTYTFAASTAMPGDGNAANDGATGGTVSIVTPISTFPYTENFDAGNGGWGSGGANSSWALGTPAKSVINSASSAPNSWVTSRTGDYNNNENSYVLSPCFDFSALALPGIEMNVWWSSDGGDDGAVLQATVDGGANWITIGGFGDPNNWYNDGALTSNPGGQQDGWSGTGAASSGGWVLAKHTMAQLAHRPSVRLRIVFASDAFTTEDGFAFDNVKIVALVPPPPPVANDLSVLAFLQPTSSCSLGNAERVSVLLLNHGTRAQSNVPVTVKYTTPSGIVRTISTVVPGPVLPGGSNAQPVLFPRTQDLSANGCYEFKAYATLAGDTVTENDTARTRICKLLISSYPYSQDFDGTADGWAANGGTWALGTPNKTVIQGAASGANAWVNGGLSGRYDATEGSSVESPCFDMRGLTNPVVQLKIWYQTENNRDGAALQYSIDNGNSWQTLGSATDPGWYNSAGVLAFPTTSRQGWTGASGGYLLVRHDLIGTPLMGSSQARFRVLFAANSAAPPAANDTDDGVAFDDFAIYEKPSNDMAVVSLQPVGSACGYGIENIVARVKNLGTQPASNFTVSYRHNSSAAVTVTVTQTLQPGAELDVPITPAVDLSAPIAHTLIITVNQAGDQIAINNSLTVGLNNNVANVAPIAPIDFESSANSLGRMAIQTRARSNVFTIGGGNNSPTAMVLTGGGGGWTDPTLPNSAWTLNGDHLATATLCVNPSNMNTNRPFYLFFDLKQVATGSGTLFTNTNLRVLINGTQVGATYRPNPQTPGTGNWQTYMIPLASFRNGNQNINIQFQSSANRGYANGSGDASFLDNIMVDVATSLDEESAFGRGVLVFPNPSTGVFRVVLDHEGANDYSLLVTDLSGRIIRKQGVSTTGHTETAVDLTSLARGVYMLRVTDANGNQSVRKITLE